MRQFPLTQQEVANHSFAIDSVSNRLPDAHFIERRLRAIEGKQIEI
jgi:hypothetical protein